MTRFSLYIHIPYCQAKCPYCDFNSHAAMQWPEAEYVATLAAELGHYAGSSSWRGGQIATIFFGGGTPSLFSAHSIGSILETVRAHWAVAADAEVTLEANPGTVELMKLEGLRSRGVNRVSFGVQSFHPHHLQRLGRIHGPGEAIAAVRAARQAGFENVNVDLIFALPEQTLTEWEADLEQACALGPDHVSAYNLTYEEGTAFHQWRARGRLRQLPEEVEAAMLERARKLLGAAGYQQYEISNYARPGRACRHNLNYWHSGPYLGVGAGAHSYSGVSDGRAPADGKFGQRWSNVKGPTVYMQLVATIGHARVTTETLDARQARGEFVFLALRCHTGLSATAFRERFGADFTDPFPHVEELRRDGLLSFASGHWRLTERGRLLADSIFATFL
jgi:oxygen-independent coproporphyrinogen-3 oxidase